MKMPEKSAGDDRVKSNGVEAVIFIVGSDLWENERS
jgi:hypothetical protein